MGAEMGFTMKRKIKWKVVVAAGAAVIAVGVIANVVFRYFRYDAYKQYLSSYEVESGSEFQAAKDDKPSVPGMVLVAENDTLKLYTNTETTEIAVYEKESGNITYSNPVERDSDAIAAGVNAAELNATLTLTYYNAARNSATMNNYDMSIEKGQFTAESIENGIRYTYTLADLDSATGIVPLQITEERLQTLVLDKLDKKDARTVKAKFRLKDGVYKLNEKAQSSKVGMGKLNKLFEQAGYTADDYAVDMSETDEKENISFTIPIEYRLTENGLSVSVPTKEIEEKGGAVISRIRVLPFFGAAGTDADGYMFVPDGSGALINLNNGCKNAAYSQNIYGIDPVVQSYVVTEYTEDARIPVFGMKNGDSAFLGRITGGDALAIVNADVSGKLNSYNYVYPEFCVREIELLNMFGVSGNQADVPVLENDIYDENLTVCYSFLSGDEADYSGMAKCYRSQPIKEGVLKETNDTGDIPLYLDVLGGVETKKHVMGVPYTGISAMTTYEEAEKILEEFYGEDITKIRMNYEGWFNGGIYHDVADKIKLVKKVGSKKDFEHLSDVLEENGGALYGNVSFQKVPYTSKRFNDVLEASKYYSGYVVELGAVNPATMRQTSTLNWYDELAYYMISPKFLSRYVDKFTDKITNYEISGICLRDLSNVLVSDKKRTELIDRQAAKQIVEAQYGKLAATEKTLMEEGGNAYTFGYVSDIIDAPVEYSQFYIIDEQVPFYQMVIHGSIDYSGEALNLRDADIDDALLLTYIEYGCAPRFTFSWEDSSVMKYTSSADQYSTCYQTWMSDAVNVYQTINGALNQVQGAAMIHHEVTEGGLVRTEYDNGVSIYINKTDKSITEDGVTVDAMSYQVKGGKA